MAVHLDTRHIDRYIAELGGANQKILNNSIRWVTKLTGFARDKMKLHIRPSTPRSEGKLQANITSKVAITGKGVLGEAFVKRNKQTMHQFLQEFGRPTKISKAIHSSGHMKFHVSAWKKAQKTPVIRMMADSDGFFRFRVVSKGKVKGKLFTERAFQKLLQFYQRKQNLIIKQLGTDIIIGKGF